MLGTISSYQIFYGSKYNASTQSVATLKYLVENLGGSSYYNIQTTYYDNSCNSLSNTLNFGGNQFVPASSTIVINDAFVINTIKLKLYSNSIPIDKLCIKDNEL
jgi:hypothetical protein